VDFDLNRVVQGKKTEAKEKTDAACRKRTPVIPSCGIAFSFPSTGGLPVSRQTFDRFMER
jgi:hypothetical protein